MPRQCTGCPYRTEDPFTNRCPICAAPLKIVCRAGNARPGGEDPRRARPGPSARVVAERLRGWLVPATVVVVLVGVLALAGLGRERINTARTRAPAPSAGARVGIGMTIRDAVLALEPVPDTSRRVSLHDLLAPDAPRTGRFTWGDGDRLLNVSFRRGRVTAVREQHIPGGDGAFDMTDIDTGTDDDTR